MRYAAGADSSHDRPEHVRAASGLARVGNRLAVIQDDASFVALVNPVTGLSEPVPLPVGPGGLRLFDDSRGNKAGKLDLEAVAAVGSATDRRLAAFGSGSLPAREVVVLLDLSAPASPRVEVRTAPAFYARLRSAGDFAGSEMNIEGALYREGLLTLFGRGNGAVVGDVRPVNASCEIVWSELLAHLDAGATAPPPEPRCVTQYELGTVDAVPLGFTDVAGDSEGAILYSAAAEASPDATRDGAVAGSVIGVLDARGASGRWTRLLDERGNPVAAKVEGLAPGAGAMLFAVVDADDHTRASELLEVHLTGPWRDAQH
jgi:hypothetical protein